ncbi:hypothetical protein Golax_017432, partial [Gossypium laxum]|nr:hypothetical protein [Gossypium laxum]
MIARTFIDMDKSTGDSFAQMSFCN